MDDSEMLTHDLARFFGVLCRCRQCTDRRIDMLMLDLGLHYNQTAARYELKREKEII